MRKLISWNMLTLDGFFEGPGKGEIDWFVFDEELERYILDTQMDAGTLLFGRVTYEGMRDYWPTADGQIADFMNGVEKVVFSRTMEDAGWSNARVVRDVKPEVARLKEAGGGNIFVFGSADLSATLMQYNLIDEYRVGLNPMILGAGIPWFKRGEPRQKLRLLETRPLHSGLVILHYAPES